MITAVHNPFIAELHSTKIFTYCLGKSRIKRSLKHMLLQFSGLLCAVYSTLLLTNAIQVDNTYFDTFSDAYSTQLYHQPRSGDCSYVLDLF